MPRRADTSAMVFIALSCVIATPFGMPVEPDVKIIYANASGLTAGREIKLGFILSALFACRTVISDIIGSLSVIMNFAFAESLICAILDAG